MPFKTMISGCFFLSGLKFLDNYINSRIKKGYVDCMLALIDYISISL